MVASPKQKTPTEQMHTCDSKARIRRNYRLSHTKHDCTPEEEVGISDLAQFPELPNPPFWAASATAYTSALTTVSLTYGLVDGMSEIESLNEFGQQYKLRDWRCTRDFQQRDTCKQCMRSKWQHTVEDMSGKQQSTSEQKDNYLLQ